MNSEASSQLEQMKVDTKNLYREEQFTDLKVAALRRLTPVLPDGSPDLARKAIFMGSTHVMTRAGPLPVEFEIEAATLEEAAAKFPAQVQRAVDEMIAEAQQLQRERASSIILPSGPMPTGPVPGLVGPGSKIKL